MQRSIAIIFVIVCALACAEAYWRKPKKLECYGKSDKVCKKSEGCECKLTQTCEKQWSGATDYLIKTKKCYRLDASPNLRCSTQWGKKCDETCFDKDAKCPEMEARCGEEDVKEMCCATCSTGLKTTPAPKCEDRNKDCKRWKKDGYCDKEWLKTSGECAKTCGACTPAEMKAADVPDSLEEELLEDAARKCVDKPNKKCDSPMAISEGWCEESPLFRENCCATCHSRATKAKSECKDTWVNNGCQKHKEWCNDGTSFAKKFARECCETCSALPTKAADVPDSLEEESIEDAADECVDKFANDECQWHLKQNPNENLCKYTGFKDQCCATCAAKAAAKCVDKESECESYLNDYPNEKLCEIPGFKDQCCAACAAKAADECVDKLADGECQRHLRAVFDDFSRVQLCRDPGFKEKCCATCAAKAKCKDKWSDNRCQANKNWCSVENFAKEHCCGTCSALPKKSPQCAWLTSTDGQGDDDFSIGFLTENECAKQCAARKVSTNQRINGATIRKSDNKCWCEIGMKSQTSHQLYKSCFFAR